jgi:Mrp family chromosome partitioning ATPase
MIKQFWRDVAWGRLDYLVVDLPLAISDASPKVMQSIPLSGLLNNLVVALASGSPAVEAERTIPVRGG